MQPEKPEIDRAQLRAGADGAASRCPVLLGRPIASSARVAGSIASTILFHKKLGSYSDKADASRAGRWIADGVWSAGSSGARAQGGPVVQGRSGRPTWCASSPSFRARWAASMRARKACPSRSGRRSTITTCRSASRRTRRRRGSSSAQRRWRGRRCRSPTSSTRWSACSPPGAADRFARSLGSGARRRGGTILVDLPELTGLDKRLKLGRAAGASRGAVQDRRRDSAVPLFSFMADRLALSAERTRLRRAQRPRGHARRRGNVQPAGSAPEARSAREMTGSPSLLGVAALLKRVKNISQGRGRTRPRPPSADGMLTEPAEKALAAALDARRADDSRPRRRARTTREALAGVAPAAGGRSSSMTCS